MIRRLLLALALLGAAPAVAPAPATDDITIISGTWPKFAIVGPYLYARYANGLADVYMPVYGRWVWIDRIWWP